MEIELSTKFIINNKKMQFMESNRILPTGFSDNYLKWAKQANLPALTNTQHKFAEWLLLEENAKIVSQIGDLDTIFISIRRWLKNRMY